MTKDELATHRHQELLDVTTRTADGVEGVKKDVAEISRRLDQHVNDDNHKHDAQELATTAREGRISKLEDRAEATGDHDIAAMKQKLSDQRDATEAEVVKREKLVQMWKGRGWAIFATLLVAAVSAGAAAYFG